MADDRETHDADDHDFDEQITQPLAFALSLERAATTQLNSTMFRRLADALEVSEAALETLLYDTLVWVDASPVSLEASDVWLMRTRLFELGERGKSDATRKRTKAALELLMFEIAPGETA